MLVHAVTRALNPLMCGPTLIMAGSGVGVIAYELVAICGELVIDFKYRSLLTWTLVLHLHTSAYNLANALTKTDVRCSLPGGEIYTCTGKAAAARCC